MSTALHNGSRLITKIIVMTRSAFEIAFAGCEMVVPTVSASLTLPTNEPLWQIPEFAIFWKLRTEKGVINIILKGMIDVASLLLLD